MSRLSKYRLRLGGFVVGLAAMALALWAFGVFAPQDRVTLVMERFESLCQPGQRVAADLDAAGRGLAPHPAAVPPSAVPTQELWDAAAEVRVSVAAARCGITADIVPFSLEEETALAAAFLTLGRAAMPDAVYEDLSNTTEGGLFHRFKNTVPDTTEALTLVRFGHDTPPHDALTLTYAYTLENPDDA